MKKHQAILDKVLNSKTQEELAEAYGQWSEQYDQDLIEDMGYVAPLITSQLLSGYVENKQARILDAGCGTGLVGACLQQQGFQNLEGLDFSTDMLKKAKSKEVYKKLYQRDLTRPLDLHDEHYDAIISVGTFTCGHVGPGAFDELIRITKPGGYICFTVREKAWQEDEYSLVLNKIEASGAWKRLEEKSTDYIQQEGSQCKACVFQKCR